jgi:hypothetical protein
MRATLSFRKNILRKIFSAFIVGVFFFNTIIPPLGSPREAHAQSAFVLPAVGTQVNLSPAFNPLLLKAVKVHADNPFQFEFIVDQGDTKLSEDQLKSESQKLIRYFLASLTTPENDLWVNLSPYEKERIIPQSFGVTEMGRDLLAQDYLLKQITATLMYPEGELGKKFWDKVHKQAFEKFGTTEVPTNTFNKVWIVPQKAVVYENGATAYVDETKLKVLLAEDYEAPGGAQSPSAAVDGSTNALASQIVRDIILPELEKEVNTGTHFAPLRQVYNSLVLANWYKKRMKDSIISQIYTDKNKVAGVDIDDKAEAKKIYDRYVQAFKKGVYNYIKEDYDAVTQESIPRKYFSGGMGFVKAAGSAVYRSGLPVGASLASSSLREIAAKLDFSRSTQPPQIQGMNLNLRTASVTEKLLRKVAVLLSALTFLVSPETLAATRDVNGQGTAYRDQQLIAAAKDLKGDKTPQPRGSEAIHMERFDRELAAITSEYKQIPQEFPEEAMPGIKERLLKVRQKLQDLSRDPFVTSNSFLKATIAEWADDVDANLAVIEGVRELKMLKPASDRVAQILDEAMRSNRYDNYLQVLEREIIPEIRRLKGQFTVAAARENAERFLSIMVDGSHWARLKVFEAQVKAAKVEKDNVKALAVLNGIDQQISLVLAQNLEKSTQSGYIFLQQEIKDLLGKRAPSADQPKSTVSASSSATEPLYDPEIMIDMQERYFDTAWDETIFGEQNFSRKPNEAGQYQLLSQVSRSSTPEPDLRQVYSNMLKEIGWMRDDLRRGMFLKNYQIQAIKASEIYIRLRENIITQQEERTWLFPNSNLVQVMDEFEVQDLNGLMDFIEVMMLKYYIVADADSDDPRGGFWSYVGSLMGFSFPDKVQRYQQRILAIHQNNRESAPRNRGVLVAITGRNDLSSSAIVAIRSTLLSIGLAGILALPTDGYALSRPTLAENQVVRTVDSSLFDLVRTSEARLEAVLQGTSFVNNGTLGMTAQFENWFFSLRLSELNNEIQRLSRRYYAIPQEFDENNSVQILGQLNDLRPRLEEIISDPLVGRYPALKVELAKWLEGLAQYVAVLEKFIDENIQNKVPLTAEEQSISDAAAQFNQSIDALKVNNDFVGMRTVFENMIFPRLRELQQKVVGEKARLMLEILTEDVRDVYRQTQFNVMADEYDAIRKDPDVQKLLSDMQRLQKDIEQMLNQEDVKDNVKDAYRELLRQVKNQIRIRTQKDSLSEPVGKVAQLELAPLRASAPTLASSALSFNFNNLKQRNDRVKALIQQSGLANLARNFFGRDSYGKFYQLSGQLAHVAYPDEVVTEAQVRIPSFIDDVFARARSLGNPSKTVIVFLEAGARPLYDVAKLMAEVQGGKNFPVEGLKSISATMANYRAMKEDPEQAAIFLGHLAQQGVLAENIEHILIVDTDAGLAYLDPDAVKDEILGTVMVFAKSVFDPEAVRRAKEIFGISVKAFNVQPQGPSLEFLYMTTPFVTSPEQKEIQAHLANLSTDVIAKLRIATYEKEDPAAPENRISYLWQSIDAFIKTHSLDGHFVLDRETKIVSVVENPPYNQEKYKATPQQINVARAMQDAGLLMGILDVMEARGFDVTKEAEDLIKNLQVTFEQNGFVASSTLIANTVNEDVGGIDLSADKTNLEIRGNGQSTRFNFDPQQWQNFQFDGLVPVILNISPNVNLPMFLSESSSSSAENQLSKVN